MMDKTGDIRLGKTPPRKPEDTTLEQLDDSLEKKASAVAERKTSKKSTDNN